MWSATADYLQDVWFSCIFMVRLHREVMITFCQLTGDPEAIAVEVISFAERGSGGRRRPEDIYISSPARV
jgi:hypothetical protein